MPFDLFNEVNMAAVEDVKQAVEGLSLQGMNKIDVDMATFYLKTLHEPVACRNRMDSSMLPLRRSRCPP